MAGELVRLATHETVSRGTVGRRLAEMKLKPWWEKMWCIPTVTAEYVARMEDVLDLYAETPDPRRTVVCFDETPRQLIGEARVPIQAQSEKPKRVDYEYIRHGTANVFLFVDVHRPWRYGKVTDHRTGLDFAACMRDLVDEHYPEADRIRVVLDNLLTHSAAALHQPFEPAEARRILSRLDFTSRRNTPAGSTWSRSAHPGEGYSRGRDRGLGGPAQRRAGGHHAVVYRRPGAQEARPRVSATRLSHHGRRMNRSKSLRRGTSRLLHSLHVCMKPDTSCAHRRVYCRFSVACRRLAISGRRAASRIGR